jgi:hypothetical protein
VGQDVAFESAGIFEPMFAAVLDSTDRIVVFEIRDFDFLGDRIFGQSQDVVGIVDMGNAGQAFDALSDVRADTCLDQIVFGGGGVLEDIVEKSSLFGRCTMALEHDAHQVQDVRIAVGIALSSMKIQSQFGGQLDRLCDRLCGGLCGRLCVPLGRFHRFSGVRRRVGESGQDILFSHPIDGIGDRFMDGSDAVVQLIDGSLARVPVVLR